MWAILGAGSNLGARAAILRAAREHLAALGVRTERCSHTYETAAMVPTGREPGPAFLNQAWKVRTSREPRRLLELLLEVERRFGRVRDRRWGNRTLDLDILWMPREVRLPELRVPHPGLFDRPFAIAPLLDVEPRLRHLLAGMRRRPPRVGPRAEGAEKVSAALTAGLGEPVGARVVSEVRARWEELPDAIAGAGLVIRRVAALNSPTKPDALWEVALVGTTGTVPIRAPNPRNSRREQGRLLVRRRRQSRYALAPTPWRLPGWPIRARTSAHPFP